MTDSDAIYDLENIILPAAIRRLDERDLRLAITRYPAKGTPNDNR